jgi:hypothetical protein
MDIGAGIQALKNVKFIQSRKTQILFGLNLIDAEFIA